MTSSMAAPQPASFDGENNDLNVADLGANRSRDWVADSPALILRLPLQLPLPSAVTVTGLLAPS